MFTKDCRLHLLLALTLFLGCERAQRYRLKPAEKDPVPAPSPGKDLEEPDWRETLPILDLPLVFVPETDPEWKKLETFWNIRPGPVLGSGTPHLGQSPLAAVAALAMSRPGEIKIRVPLGLPDPTPHIPPTNPPTLLQWQLGRDLFREPILRVGADDLSCASCHRPDRAFADDRTRHPLMRFNALSLINVAYNRRQFWDGRVETLEETLFPPWDKEGTAKPASQHHWAGMVKELVKRSSHYHYRFHQAFGLATPTQDATARALATYMRTLLRGGSLADWADKTRRDRGEPKLSAAHLEPLLNDRALKATLDRAPEKGKRADEAKKREVAQEWELGYRLFHDQGRCVVCHRGPLYTDQDYHNLSIGESAKVEGGRFERLPLGLKDARFKGAFRTPSLRNLQLSARYFHDGSGFALRDVVKFYSDPLLFNQHLDKVFLDDQHQPRALNLSLAEMEALVVFLRSLEGEPLDPMVTGELDKAAPKRP